MKNIYFTLLAAGTLSLAACSNDFSLENENIDQTVTEQKPVMGAVNGELLVKISPSVIEGIESYAKSSSRSAGRSGDANFDDALSSIGTYHFERVFPVDVRSEERTREVGLHQWYVVRFDEIVELEKAYKELAALSGIVTVQYSPTIQRGYKPKKATVVSQEAMNAMNRTTASTPFNDPQLRGQWGYINTGETLNGVKDAVAGLDLNCAEAWDICGGDNSIIVAVLDEGVMYDHEDLKDNMWINPKEAWGSKEDLDGNGYAGDVYGYNFVLDSPFISYDDAYDTGHGTHVAGTVAAVNNNGVGVAGVAGGTGKGDGVKIMSCQIFAGNKGITLYNEARAIKYAADNGAVILQCSWGYNSALADPNGYYPGPATDKEWASMYALEKEALDYFVNYAGSANGVIQGGIAIFAAGNEGAGAPAYPSAYDEYISVAALDAAGMPSNFSNYGDRIKIAAPGGDSDFHEGNLGTILSTVPAATLEGYNPSIDNNRSGYGYMEGTSMACPAVSGVAALGLSYAVQQRRHFKAADFRKLMYESCTPVENSFTETKYYWDLYNYYGETTRLTMEPAAYRGKMGYGLIDAATLLKKIEGGAGVDMRVPNTTVSLEGTASIELSRYFLAGEQLTYTCSVEDNSVATIAVNGTVATITGAKTGSVQATVTASNGKVQTFVITVRNQSGNNGWM